MSKRETISSSMCGWVGVGMSSVKVKHSHTRAPPPPFCQTTPPRQTQRSPQPYKSCKINTYTQHNSYLLLKVVTALDPCTHPVSITPPLPPRPPPSMNYGPVMGPHVYTSIFKSMCVLYSWEDSLRDSSGRAGGGGHISHFAWSVWRGYKERSLGRSWHRPTAPTRQKIRESSFNETHTRIWASVQRRAPASRVQLGHHKHGLWGAQHSRSLQPHVDLI